MKFYKVSENAQTSSHYWLTTEAEFVRSNFFTDKRTVMNTSFIQQLNRQYHSQLIKKEIDFA